MPTPTKRELTHQRIVDAAARALRRDGFAGVGVAEVMKQAGLTHGGFYAHFASREALLAEAVQRAAEHRVDGLAERTQASIAAGMSPLQAVIESYLSVEHMEATEYGCLVGALGSEMARQGETLLAASREQVDQLVARVAQVLPEDAPPGQAVAIGGALVGILQLARVAGRDEAGRALLAQGREALIAQYVKQ